MKSKETINLLKDLSNDRILQIYAMDALSQIDDLSVLQIFNEFGPDPVPSKSKYAVELIAKIQKPESVDILIEVLKKTSTEDLKIKMIYSGLQRLIGKDFRTKNQWLEWYQNQKKN